MTESRTGRVSQGPQTSTATVHLDDQLCFALYAATNAIIRSYRPLLADLGLTYPQYLVMLSLWQRGDSSVGEIARHLSLQPHAVTPIVSRLVDAGLLSSTRDSADRRRVVVSLTPSGHAMEPRAAAAQQQVACSTHLSPEEMAGLRQQLHDLAGTLDPAVPTLPTTEGAA